VFSYLHGRCVQRPNGNIGGYIEKVLHQVYVMGKTFF